MTKKISKQQVIALVETASLYAGEIEDVYQDIRYRDGKLYIADYESEDGGENIITKISPLCYGTERWAEVEGDLGMMGFEITE